MPNNMQTVLANKCLVALALWPWQI